MKRALVAALLLTLASCGDQSSAPLPSDRSGAGPLEARCEVGDQVRVTVFVEAPNGRAFGVHTRVRYPAVLAIPGRADDQSVFDRVQLAPALPTPSRGESDETVPHALIVVNDQDTDFDGVDDRIHVLVASIDTFPDGRFADLRFDCVSTIAWPSADLFACEVAGSPTST